MNGNGVVDIGRTSASRANGHGPTSPPVYRREHWDADLLVFMDLRDADVPVLTEGRVRVIINADDSMTIEVKRPDLAHSLILCPKPSAPPHKVWREVLAALLGTAA